MKCLASTQGPKVRVNAILPGLLLTEWVSINGFSCVLGADTDLGRQLHTGEASGGERQSLPKERGWSGSTARGLSCKLILEQTGLEDCANAYVAVARNSSMTGQNIQIGAYIQRVLPAISDHHLDSGLMMLGRTG